MRCTAFAGLNQAWRPSDLSDCTTVKPYGKRSSGSLAIGNAGIAGGPHAYPKGIRYGFLVEAIRCGIILTRTEKWMGYSQTDPLRQCVEQLALYAPELVGDERDDASLI